MISIAYSNKFSQINFFRILSLLIQYFYKKHRLRCINVFLLTFTLCFIYTIANRTKNVEYLTSESYPTHIFNPNTSLYIPITQVKNHSHQLILLWTDLFDNFYWHQPLFFNSSIIISCSSIYQCQFTRDKNKFSQASAIAFHLYNMKRYELPERKLSIDNQKWIFITGESPINFYYQNPSFYPSILDNYFDRSISYKFDSPYPIFSPIIKSRNLSIIERQMNINSLKLKKKPIAWIVSNCKTFSQRENYVKELNKFISIDIYGRCGISCSNDNNHQCQIDLNEYYFYLAFENSRCNSYITEKFWNIISDDKHRLVPIVMGANKNHYEQIAPKQSFIHVDEYKTPQDLARYLNYLIQNLDKYLLYLKWREHTEIELISPGRWMNFLCPICQMSYETQLVQQNRVNFSSWFNPKFDCHHDDVELFKKCKQTTLNVWMSWIHNIKCP